ncbi:MAG: SDR family NAD(P)-dependent oxidoreductase [Candidatus Atabeyarchaeum deiterrae]|jgi:3-oxoacyl-[acyl-carrier protein] reductase
MAKLTGKVAIITGAARGIGQATAELFAKEGADIVVADMADGAETVNKVKATGRKAIFVKTDVSKFDEVTKLVEATIKEFKKVDILINNAGIIRDKTIWNMTPEDYDLVLGINLKGCWNCIKAVASGWRERAKADKTFKAKIVSVSSIAGLHGNFGQTNYSAAKSGIVGLTKTAAKELAAANVYANCVALGFIETQMTAETALSIGAKTVDEGFKIMKNNIVGAGREGVVANQIPAKPLEAAKVILFLASDDSDIINGQVIEAYAGWKM